MSGGLFVVQSNNFWMKMVNTEIYNDFITRSDTFKIISDEIFKSLLDNTFAVLTGKSEVHGQ